MYNKTSRPSRSGGSRSGSGSSRGKFAKRSFGGKKRSGGYRGGSRRGGGGKKKMPSFDPSQFINTNPVEIKEEVFKAKNTFETFGLDQKFVDVIHKLGITVPSPIQDQIIPEIFAGNDVIGLAETGTGKTAAFLVPLIQKTAQDDSRQTLILTPTRELAIQIQDEFRKLSRAYRLFGTVCVGGMPIFPQIKALRRKIHFVIGTPGRIQDLIDRGDFDPSRVKTVVLDEADRMLDMGFINDMRSILKHTPKDRETLFFSATMNKKTEGVVHEFLDKPVTISVKKKDVTNSIAQDVVRYDARHKFDTLVEMLKDEKEFSRVIIFGSMKHSVEELAIQLTGHNIKADSIHGNKNHRQRQNALNRFKKNEVRVLVATDVAARGIHVDDVSHVINYDLPQQFEDYVHRIGRTGRGEKKGKALTFVPNKMKR